MRTDDGKELEQRVRSRIGAFRAVWSYFSVLLLAAFVLYTKERVL
jgi:hypothetical protein